MNRLLTLRCIFLCFAWSLILSACKLQPNQLRSNLSRSDAFDLIDRSTIGFKRRADNRSGDLFFTLKGPYKCRLTYWANDLDVAANAQSPMIFDCPADTTQINFVLTNLEPGIPYSFQINVWPANLTPDASAAVIFTEGEALNDQRVDHMVVARHVIPRRSTELHTFQFNGETSLLEIRNQYIEHFRRPSDAECTTEELFTSVPFARHTSSDDQDGRPLHGLGNVASDGYAQAGAQDHPFFQTRRLQFYPSIERLQNWEWVFQWEGQTFQFEVYPPGFIEELTFLSNDNGPVLSNRNLGGASPVVDLQDEEITLELKTMFPSDIAFVHVKIQDPFDDDKRIHCTFPADRQRYTIPRRLVSQLPEGSYDLTTIYETVQIQYRSGTPYPPWIISSQDWIHTRLSKRF